jgi:hypothetical protein
VIRPPLTNRRFDPWLDLWVVRPTLYDRQALR